MPGPFSIIHLSDLHFGKTHDHVLEHLDDFLRLHQNTIKLAIFTGDLTQRARKNEFLAAKKFIESLNSPFFVVPGNHDIPLYNLFLRFLSPYKRFLKYLGPFAQNFYEDDTVAVYGLWTVNNFSIQSGRLSEKDIEEMEKRFNLVPDKKIRIIASHHPVLSIDHPRIQKDITRLLKVDPHFLLWGHDHQSEIRSLKDKKVFPMILASGTTTSSRTRAETNSFNMLTFHEDHFVTEIYRHSRILGGFEVIDRKVHKLAA